MYALSKSVLNPYGFYRVEVYNMSVLSHDAHVIVELKIFGEGEYETYIGDYEITREDGKTNTGACMNQPTKEATKEAVECAVLKALESKDSYWS